MTLSWILMLTMNLLACLAAPTDIIVLNSDIATSLRNLTGAKCSELNSTFYSPSGSNGCIRESLNCSLKELMTVAEECFDKNPSEFRQAKRLRISINKLLNETQKNASPLCTCEDERNKKPYEGFIKNLMTLLQMLNSSYDLPKNA